MDNMLFIWLIALIVLIVIELATMGLTTIWFALGALVAAITAALHAPVVLQVVLFLVISIVSFIFTRPLAVKYFNRDRVRTNVESLIGRRMRKQLGGMSGDVSGYMIVTGELTGILLLALVGGAIAL